ncbi:MAG: HEAT repeat domain-containing protein [Terriglobia bacterium]
MEEKLTLYLYDELPPEERAGVEAHLEECAQCAQASRELGRLRAALDRRAAPEPSPELLVHCREALEDALDQEEQSWRALLRSWFVVPPGVSLLRATSAVVILLVGLSAGWTLRPRLASSGTPAPRPAANPWTGADLSGLRIRGISQVTPDLQTGQVRITLEAERHLTLAGSFDDPRIQEVLLYALRDGDNAGIRRDTLEALRGRVDNPTVREALLYALRHDPNPGVRLEAIGAVQRMNWGPELRQALLQALQQDTNPGVRVAVIGVLVEHPDEQVLSVLEELAGKDRNPYVRMQCAQAAREGAVAPPDEKEF